MSEGTDDRAAAQRPEQLAEFFVRRANAGDVEGLVALYEPDAVLAFPAGQQPTIVNGDLALTSTLLPGGGATVEVARRRPDGTWRWIIDRPSAPP